MQKANFDEEEERSKIFVWNKKAFERAILFIANTQAATNRKEGNMAANVNACGAAKRSTQKVRDNLRALNEAALNYPVSRKQPLAEYV